MNLLSTLRGLLALTPAQPQHLCEKESFPPPHRLLCNTGARFHVRRGNIVANALTLQRFGKGRVR